MDKSTHPKMIDILTEIAPMQEPFSDILFRSDAPVMARFPEGWRPLFDDVIEISMLNEFANHIEPDSDDFITRGMAISRSIAIPVGQDEWRMRVDIYSTLNGRRLNAMVRRLPPVIPSLVELGLPKQVQQIPRFTHGLVLIVGSTRSGKSTTLASVLNEINQRRSCHIVSIEDPVEYVVPEAKSLFSPREVGVDCASFASGVREALRQCPEVIAIGEIRDAETARCALEASESGHLVFGTLHANNAVSAISKFAGLLVNHEGEHIRDRFALALQAIVSQVLLPRADGNDLILASEMVFNHKDQHTGILFDSERLAKAIANRDSCSLSYSMESFLRNLVTQQKISASDASLYTGISLANKSGGAHS
jgi:twitching motility protein PilT